MLASQAQPALFAVPPNPKDVVYTPDNVACDMVAFFKPRGRILEPSKGDGVFLKYLPGADWCEITEGRDFFTCARRYDWIIGNPPYSIFAAWLRHSFTLADDIVYLIPIIRCFVSSRIIKDIKAFGESRRLRSMMKQTSPAGVSILPSARFIFSAGTRAGLL